MTSGLLQGLPTRARRLWLFLLLLITLAAAAVRCVPLPREALSGDEIFSLQMVVEPASRALHDVRQDLVHPPLYYITLKTITRLSGTSAPGLRLLSLGCGLLTLPVLALLGGRLPGARWCGLLAAGCVAAGRFDVFYSQEARSYAMYTLLVVLLAWWVSYLSEPSHAGRYWICGSVLMTLLVYTHYVGGVFVALAILGVLVSSVARRTKLRALGCGIVALVLFLPWFLGEVGVYHAKRGLGANLDWEGRPDLYALRQVWAQSLGVDNFPGATWLALLLTLLLSGAALLLLARKGALRRTPAVLSVTWMGWCTPLVIFALSRPPLNLPLFGLRHVLPSTVLLALLCAYGLELLTRQARRAQTPLLLAGSACLLALAAVPTAQVLGAGCARFPYDRVAAWVQGRETHQVSAFTVSYYLTGRPTNFYCGYQCVRVLPDPATRLPAELMLLYRPASKAEVDAYRHVLQQGYAEVGDAYFTNGTQSSFGTMVAMLRRTAR